MNILFVGGGSVGHIAPSVAVWNACKDREPNASAHFVCSPRPDDAAFLKANDLPFTVLDAPRLSIAFPLRIIRATKMALRILRDIQPDIVFSKGGYVSIPLCYAAKKLGIPIVLHESDAVSGYANQVVSKWASRTCTGHLLRKDITEGSKSEGLSITGLSGEKPILLVTGGSQGSKALNEAVWNNLDDLLLRCDIIHVTGRGKANPSIPNTAHYFQTEFADEELKHFYASADLALSRAGASNIGELTANGIPSIFVPLRGVGHDHQMHNAKAATENGYHTYLEQRDLEEKLTRTVHTLITQEKSPPARPTDAALQIAEILVQTLDNHSSGQ